MANQGQVGFEQSADGQPINVRLGNFGQQMVQQTNGKYAEMARRGQLFLYSTPAAGQAFITTATTGGFPTIWNPSNSGKVGYILSVAVTWLSGTTTAGALLAAITPNTGPNIGTGLPIVTFTKVVQLGNNPGYASAMYWSPTTNTFTAAPTVIATTGINLGANPGAIILQQDYDGQLAIYPGNAISLVYSVTTSTALYMVTAAIGELPYYP
jgi:hypothetical protein